MSIAGHYLVNTSNLGQAEDILGKAYGRVTIAPNGAEAEPWIRVWRTRVGPATLDDAEISSSIRYELDTPNGVALCRVRAGRVDLRTDDHVGSYGRGDVMAVVGDGVTMTGVLADARCDIVSFDPSVFDDGAVAARHLDCPAAIKRVASPVSASAGQLVADVIVHIRHFIANNPQVSGEPLVVASAARYLLATAMTAFPRSAFLA